MNSTFISFWRIMKNGFLLCQVILCEFTQSFFLILHHHHIAQKASVPNGCTSLCILSTADLANGIHVIHIKELFLSHFHVILILPPSPPTAPHLLHPVAPPVKLIIFICIRICQVAGSPGRKSPPASDIVSYWER